VEEMNSIRAHDEEVAQYDQQVRDSHFHGHDVLFGMAFEYVKPHETLLDIGIGTGLASLPFAKAGLKIFGLDGSVEMLHVCESKGFAKGLKQFDLKAASLPYSDHSFDHVICCGVFHFFSELGPIVKEISRVIKPGGIFAFTIAAQASQEKRASNDDSRMYVEKPTPWGVSIYAHNDRCIDTLLQNNCFEMLKDQKILMWSGKEDVDDLLFQVIVARNVRL
jgi:ubiquinone/menaquinone biosynthesis C-methylase UbiE